MRSKRKALALALCAVLLVVTSVLGTIAYLTDSESVTNTFTVGQVHIKLDETDVNADGTPIEGAERVAGNAYHLLPGHTYVKDPTVTVLKDSEECYVRMKVTVNDITKLKAAMPKSEFDNFYTTVGEKDIFLLQMLCYDGIEANKKLTWDAAKWEHKVANYSETTTGEGKDAVTSATYEFWYVETDTVAKNTAKGTTLPALFEKITVPGEIDNGGILNLKDVTITVTAEAIQADGFEDADDAWNNF